MAPNWPFIILVGHSGSFGRKSNYLLSQDELSFSIKISEELNQCSYPTYARHSIHTERQRTFQDSHMRIKRLLAEQGFLRQEYTTKEELVNPIHFSSVSSTSTFPELKLNVTITI